MILTYKYRIKDSNSASVLNKMARSVNFAFNYCNETSFNAIRNNSKWLSDFDLNNLMAGASKELGIHSQTLQAISAEYVSRRKQFKKRKLRWRSKKSLGWIPFKKSGIVVKEDTVKYCGHTFRFWKSRDIPSCIKTGSFNQDARGRWYVNFQCEVAEILPHGKREIGIDLGCKDQVVCSDGIKYSRGNLTKLYADKLAKAQRANKKKQVTAIHAKLTNIRKDWNHKVTTEIARTSSFVSVGDITTKNLVKTRMAKSLLDSSHGEIKSMLEYKAIKHQLEIKFVKENGTTRTCSVCSRKTGPSGLRGLSVREWTCSFCGTVHDRDINSAKNHLRLGHQTPKRESPGFSRGEDVNLFTICIVWSMLKENK